MPNKHGSAGSRTPNYLEALFENLIEGVVVYDAEGRVADFNPAALSVLGVGADQLTNHQLSSPYSRLLVRADGSKFSPETIPGAVALATGKPVFAELMGIPQPPTGDLRWVSVNANPLFKEGTDRPFQVLCTMRDVTESQVMRERLSQSEALFKSFFENSPIGIILLDEDRRYLKANKFYCQLLGYTEEELQRRTIFELTHPDDLTETEDAASRLRQEGFFLDRLEKRMMTKDGRPVWVRVTSQRFDFAGLPGSGLLSLIEDYTEARAYREELKSQRDLIEDIAANIPGAIYAVEWDKARNQNVIYVSQGVTSLYGRTPEEIKSGTNVLIDSIHPEDRESLVSEIVETFENPRPARWSGRSVLPDGTVKWLELSARTFPQADGSVRWNTLHIDKSDVKEAEIQLRRLALLMESTSDFVSCATPDGKVLFRNRAWRERINEDGESSFISGDCVPAWAQKMILDEALPYACEHGLWQGQTAIIDRDGQVLPTSQVIFCHKDSQGRPEYFGTIIRDTSELRKLHSDLMHASKLTSLGEMAGGIAHEINNPLAIIQGKAALMRDRLANKRFDADSFAYDLERIEQTAVRIAKIVKSLKSFTRSADGEPMHPVSMRTIIEDTLELCRERFKNESINLRVHSLPASETIECRPTQIAQILLNLLNNAHDAVEGCAVREIALEVECTESEVRISVTDSGPGIPPAKRARLMEPFFTTKPIGKGMGLGLSISKSLATDHGGSLFLDTSHSATRFVLELPRVQHTRPS